MKKKEKGITLITLTVAVAILIIITSLLIYNAKNGIRMRNLKMMQNDIELLDDKIDAYYVKYGKLPLEIRYQGNIYFTPGENDNDIYYVIDLKALEGLSLNYGDDFSKINSEDDTLAYDDIYIINEQSHHIYYSRGIEMDGMMYYTNDNDDEIEEIKIGNYLIDGKIYAETLQEAIDASQDGSTIKVVRDSVEIEEISINKNITLDTNGKTINADSSFITIEESFKVVIKGSGIISEENSIGGSFIRNNGELEINDATITSQSGSGSLSGTIGNYGILTINSGKIEEVNKDTAICGGNITVNGGKICGSVRGPIDSLRITINDGEVDEIDLKLGGNCTINGGKIIDEIFVMRDAGSYNITIGDINKELSKTNPEINRIDLNSGQGYGPDDLIINFYNGIIKDFLGDIEGGTYNIRTGYQTQTTSEGTILVKN